MHVAPISEFYMESNIIILIIVTLQNIIYFSSKDLLIYGENNQLFGTIKLIFQYNNPLIVVLLLKKYITLRIF